MSRSQELIGGAARAQRQIVLHDGIVVEVVRAIVSWAGLRSVLAEDPPSLASMTEEAQGHAVDLLSGSERLMVAADQHPDSALSPVVIGRDFTQFTWLIV